MLRRLRALTEAECYVRCYGSTEPTVRLVRLEPPRPRRSATLTGEQLRQLFEERIDGRDESVEAA
ncbi:MAG TPA: hypothetical protein VGF23_08200 [Gaiellaceae bacterium]|jgi:hypothetical protein